MIQFIKAILIGALAVAVKRLGPSIVIFVYVTFHAVFLPNSADIEILPFQQQVFAILIMAGACFLLFAKIRLGQISKELDIKSLKHVDKFVLRNLNKYDLCGPTIRKKTWNLIYLTKNVVLLTLLLVICFFIFDKLAYAFALALVLIVVQSYMLSTWPNRNAKRLSPFLATEKLDAYGEASFILAIVISILYLIPHGQLTLAAVGLLLMTRFLSSFKQVGKHIYWLQRGRIVDRLRMRR
jgi:hypothetical protein